MKIYHNPRCSKSRDSFNLLTESGLDFETVEYLKNPPTREELKTLLAQLDMPAEALIRKGDADYKEHFKGKNLTEDQWIDAMIAYPKLIERPIVVKGNKAVVGRPIEQVIALLKN
jgi:arsenate reductase